MKLVVGFITYNESSLKYLADFLPSLKKALAFLAPSELRVLAFDNSDQNNSLNREALETFAKMSPGFIEYLQSAGNIGFGRAYNIMIRAANRLGAEYFLIINPDTLLETDTIFELVAALDNNSDLASVSPKIRRWDFATNTKTRVLDSCGLVLKSGLRFSDLGQGIEDDKRFDKFSILGPSGAAGLYRLSALEQIKENEQFFDERFFMYKEDCDLAYRLFLKNSQSALVPTAIMYHDRTAAASGDGLLKKIADRRKKSHQIRAWSFRNQQLIFVKHWSSQNLASKIVIVFRNIANFIFCLILEQFLLKEYGEAGRLNKVLTNVK